MLQAACHAVIDAAAETGALQLLQRAEACDAIVAELVAASCQVQWREVGQYSDDVAAGGRGTCCTCRAEAGSLLYTRTPVRFGMVRV